MKDYNGFTGAQRAKAARWLNAQWKAGTLAPPVRCDACPQTQGIFHAHAEDYSEPFAAGKTDAFHLCYRCHMMVHCRFKAPAAWERYKREIAAGAMFAPFFKVNYYGIIREHLDGWSPSGATQGEPQKIDVLALIG